MNQKGFSPLLVILGIILAIGIAGGAYYLGRQTAPKPQTPNPVITSQTPQPTTISQTIPIPFSSPDENIIWQTQTLTLQEETVYAGRQILNMTVKIPSNWTLQTTQIASNSDYLIKNCSIYTVTSKDQLIKLVLQPICKGWAAKHSNWPPDGIIVLQQKRNGNDGPHNYYRIRYTNSVNNYNYVDSQTNINSSLDKNKDQVMDAITIGYTPPDESIGDYSFIPAYLTAAYSGSDSQKDKYLTIVDQIAASITLHK